MAIMKKGMGKPMKKAQTGTTIKKDVKKKTYPIISESGDLADALNAYEEMKRKGTVPKTDAESRKYMNNLAKKGKLGPTGAPKKKMGGVVKKAQNGTKFGMASVKAKVDNNPNPTAADRIVLAKKNAGKAKMGKLVKKKSC